MVFNNKRIGSEFEREMCGILAERGYWVHFISPNNAGMQPFDLIFAKNGIAFAADCKTSEDGKIRLGRLEDNQRLAFEKWLACGNSMPIIFVKNGKSVYRVWYDVLKKKRSIDLREVKPYYVFPSE